MKVVYTLFAILPSTFGYKEIGPAYKGTLTDVYTGTSDLPFAREITKTYNKKHDEFTVEGRNEFLLCHPNVCETPGDCKLRDPEHLHYFWSEDCCSGPDCPEESKCGDQCSLSACSVAEVAESDRCLNGKCYSCQKGKQNEELYTITERGGDFICAKFGEKVRRSNRMVYNWAIACYETTKAVGGSLVGDIECAAYRDGAEYNALDGNDGTFTGYFPCYLLQLAECGCGPADMNTFGLPEPVKPCELGDCPILCSDQPPDYKEEVCDSFPGDIDWWEGDGKLNPIGVKLGDPNMYNLFRKSTLNSVEQVDFSIDIQQVKDEPACVEEDENVLDSGAILGIALGCIVFGLALGFLIALLCRKEEQPDNTPLGKYGRRDEDEETMSHPEPIYSK